MAGLCDNTPEGAAVAASFKAAYFEDYRKMAGAVDAGLSTVSQRLKVLRAEQLVSKRRQGKHIYYSLADEHIAGLVRNALEHVSHKS